MDSGFHKSARIHGEANEKFEENFKKIKMRESKGKVEKVGPGHVRITYGGKNA
jgi:hypothetical protein